MIREDVWLGVAVGFVLGCVFMAIVLGAIMAHYGWDQR